MRENNFKTEVHPRFFYDKKKSSDAMFIKCYKKLKVSEYNCSSTK